MRRSLNELAGLDSSALVGELNSTFEELDVAEEELRAQSDELERAHRRLVADREHYRAMFEHAPVAYLVTDRYGSVQDANRAAAALFRCHAERLRGKPFIVFARARSRPRVRTLLAQLGATTEQGTTRFTIRDRASKLHLVEAMASVIRDEQGAMTGVRWLLVDQTRRVRRERERAARAEELETLVAQRTAQLERAQATKDRLIATVSHELRTALSAVGGYAELLELGVRGPMSAAQLRDVQRIRRACDHLSRVVDDLLNYSRLVSGEMVIDRTDVVLSDVVARVQELAVPSAIAKEVTIHVGECPATVVHADNDRLRQILLNVLSNAVKFTPRGGTVRLWCEETPTQVLCRISDTGMGIPADKLELVFEPFIRLAGAISEPGTGLGLSISRDLARAMGGELSAESSLGVGSTFTLAVPRSTPLAESAVNG
jgi:PAS domain S-box-containing protein